MKLEIKIYPAKVLRQKARPVEKITSEVQDIIHQMIKLMKKHDGVGLAANQVGVLKQIIVIMTGSGPLALINPEIIFRQGEREEEEGCLSLPGVIVRVKRAEEIKVRALDKKGMEIVLQANGLPARAIQHEIDHLQGKLIIDYLNFWQKRKIKLAVRDE